MLKCHYCNSFLFCKFATEINLKLFNMQDLKERAANYAAEKTNELLSKAIAQAYADGYRDGLKERERENLQALKSEMM